MDGFNSEKNGINSGKTLYFINFAEF